VNFLTTLNPEQLAAATAPADSSTLVLAGAGSGKTRVLTTRIAWLIQTGQASSGGLLAVTFTNKAAKEMLTRIGAQLPIATHSMWVGTFHGLCNRFLRLHYREASLPQSFQVLDSQDQLSAIKRQCKIMGMDDKTYPPKQAAYFINNAKENGFRPDGVIIKDPISRTYAALYAAYQAQCEREGVVDFSELLLRTYEVLSKNSALRQHYQLRFRHILVDEFQDTNALQYEWLKLLSGVGQWANSTPPASVLAVGDDDQSIYAFRGAKVGNMQDFEREFKATGRIKLEQNYRSVSHVLNCANALIAHNTQRLGKKLWTAMGDGDKPRVFEAPTDLDEARFVVEEIGGQLRMGMPAKSLAILYRSNAQSRVLEQALFNAGIPYKVYGGLRFFERAEVKSALAYLRLMANPHDDNAFLRVVNFPTRGIGSRSIEVLQAEAQTQQRSLYACVPSMVGKTGTGLAAFVRLLDALRFATQGMSLPELVDYVVNHSGLIAHYQTEKEGAARVENLNELSNAAAGFTGQEGYAANAIGTETAAETEQASPLAGFLAHASLEAGDNQAQSGMDAVQMMTVHASKGLEFDAVFICGVEEGLFPHENSAREPKGVEEERRLMYVAITRARKRLWLTFAARRMVHGQSRYSRKSDFFDDLPEADLHWLTPKNNGYNSPYKQALQGSSWGRDSEGDAVSNAPRWGKTDTQKRYDDADTGRGAQVFADKILAKQAVDPGYLWRVGQQVRHARFGEGTIVALEGRGDDARARINFTSVGSKVLILIMAKLERV
jgi:DNA helicase II / ATP-dependent DNA helicase PcrA